MLCAVVVLLRLTLTGCALPASIRSLEAVARDGIWTELVRFFEDGVSDDFRIAVDATCVSEPLEVPFPKRGGPGGSPPNAPGEAALTHRKWSAEVWLPLMLGRSKWGTTTSDNANATLVMFRSRATARQKLSLCKELLSLRSEAYRKRPETFWFPAISSRGACCDGGQVRDPSIMSHHFIGHVGERREGPWLFREARFADHLRRTTQYKAPVSRDTSPYLRCFDNRKDIAIPPPAVLLRQRHISTLGSSESDRITACAASRGRDALNCYLVHDFQKATEKDILVMHAEGKQGGLEYDLRRAITELWDPEFLPPELRAGKKKRSQTYSPFIYPEAKTHQTKDRARRDPKIQIHFSIPFTNYSNLMRRSKYCVVSEGYSPWSPRLAEAVAVGCVPVLLSPALEPPYADVLDWSKFAVRVDEADLPRLPDVLAAKDHADLHANLLRVQPLFAFCVDEGGEDDCGGQDRGDALALIVFDMWRKSQQSRKRRHTSSLSGYAGVAELAAGRGPDGAEPTTTAVRYACRLDENGTCAYEFHGDTWLCTMVNALNCECAKRKQDGWAFVGDTSRLRGHKTYLWANGGPPSPIGPDPGDPNRGGIVRYQPADPRTYLATASDLVAILRDQK